MNARPLLLLGMVLGLQAAEPHPCRPASASSCQACHAQNLEQVHPARASRPCTPYCQACHFKEDPRQHHPVGQVMRRSPRLPSLQLNGNKLACATCHDLSSPREDQVRWKAASLFDRAFRRQSSYKTYQLVTRNDRGQLCVACH